MSEAQTIDTADEITTRMKFREEGPGDGNTIEKSRQYDRKTA